MPRTLTAKDAYKELVGGAKKSKILGLSEIISQAANNGDSTGDEIADFVFRRKGGYDPELISTYSRLKDLVAGHTGSSIAVQTSITRQERFGKGQKWSYRYSHGEGVSITRAGVIKGGLLIGAHSMLLVPTGSYFSAQQKHGIGAKTKPKVVDGDMPIEDFREGFRTDRASAFLGKVCGDSYKADSLSNYEFLVDRVQKVRQGPDIRSVLNIKAVIGDFDPSKVTQVDDDLLQTGISVPKALSST